MRETLSTIFAVLIGVISVAFALLLALIKSGIL